MQISGEKLPAIGMTIHNQTFDSNASFLSYNAIPYTSNVHNFEPLYYVLKKGL